MVRILDTCWVPAALPAGWFRCPHCREDNQSRVVALHPWLELFGHRLVRIGRTRTFSICGTCSRAYETEERHDARPRSEDERAILGIVAAVIFSDSRIRETEKRAAREVIRRYAGLELGSIEIDAVFRDARRRRGDPVDGLRRLSPLLDQAAKLRIVEAAYLVSTADHELHSQESRLLDRIGGALDLPPRELTRAIQRARRTPH